MKRHVRRSSEALNQAQQDVIGFELRLDLETMRLGEIMKGPLVIPQVTAETDVKNNEALLDAATDTYNISQYLADRGYLAREDARSKKLAMEQQRAALMTSKIALQRLDILDPVAIAAQELAVHNAKKTLSAAKEKVTMLEANIKRDEERYAAGMDSLKSQLKKRTEDLEHCVCTAPGDGVVVYAKGRWYDFAPGRQVWDGVKVMSIPDFSKLKVALTIDEARVSGSAVSRPVRRRDPSRGLEGRAVSRQGVVGRRKGPRRVRSVPPRNPRHFRHCQSPGLRCHG